MYIICRFYEVSAIREPKIITFSITGSQIFFANFVFSTITKQYSAYWKTVNNTKISLFAVFFFFFSHIDKNLISKSLKNENVPRTSVFAFENFGN